MTWTDSRARGRAWRWALASGRADMLHIALMSSENRAASALGRHYPGGRKAFIEAMSTKAACSACGASFADSTGLNPTSVSTARSRQTGCCPHLPADRQYTASSSVWYATASASCTTSTPTAWYGRKLAHSGLQDRLYPRGGRCLVMGTRVNNEPVVMVLLHANTTDERVADARKIKSWLETSGRMTLTAQSTPQPRLFSSQ